MGEPTGSGVDRAAQMNDIYQALGLFLVEFSRMVSSMEVGLLYVTGGADQRLIRAIVAELTADPLARAWRSAMIQATELTENDKRVLSGVAAEISSLINLRNDWAHGIWFVGYGDEATGDWSRAGLMRFKNSAKGLAAPSKLEGAPTAEYIRKVAAYTALVGEAIFSYGTTVSVRQRGDIDTAVRPGDRIRIMKVDGNQQLEVTQDGSYWRSAQWP
jgi:hypothetical protein